jgi:ABC-type branched-subunit amino acid transport system substrate-binding protein
VSRSHYRYLGALLALGVGLTACSSSTAGTASGTSGSLGANPIKIMAWGTFSGVTTPGPQQLGAVEAEADLVNASGGIGGRKIDIISCDDQGSANLADTCAREAVSDTVAAVLSLYGVYAGSNVLPIIAPHNIPLISQALIQPQEGTSPDAFPVETGVYTAYYGMGLEIVKSGCKKVGLLTLSGDGGAATFEAAGIEGALAAAGLPNLTTVAAAAGLPSYASQVATLAADNIDCLGVLMPGPAFVSSVTAARQQVPSVRLFTDFSDVTSQLLTQLGSVGTGITVTGETYSNTDTEIPQVTTVDAAVAKYDAGAGVDPASIGAWVTLEVALAAARKVPGTLSAAKELAALDALKNYSTGLVPPLTWSAQGNGTQGFQRVANLGYLAWKTANDKLVLQTPTFQLIPMSSLVKAFANVK